MHTHVVVRTLLFALLTMTATVSVAAPHEPTKEEAARVAGDELAGAFTFQVALGEMVLLPHAETEIDEGVIGSDFNGGSYLLNVVGPATVGWTTVERDLTEKIVDQLIITPTKTLISLAEGQGQTIHSKPNMYRKPQWVFVKIGRSAVTDVLKIAPYQAGGSDFAVVSVLFDVSWTTEFLRMYEVAAYPTPALHWKARLLVKFDEFKGAWSAVAIDKAPADMDFYTSNVQ